MNRLQILRALFVESGTYNDMVSRPYQSNGDYNVLHQFQEVTQGGQFISPQNLAGVAGNFLKPAGNHEGAVGIYNGWNTPRFRFMIHCWLPSNFGGTEYIISGYTDHAELDQHGRFAPHMLLTFNNTQTIRVTNEPSVNGMVQRRNIAEAAQIVGGDYNPGFGQNPMANTYTMRPSDVFARIMTLDMGHDVHDYRVNFSERHKKSNRLNGNAANYVHKALDSYRTSIEDENPGNSHVDMVGKMDTARGMVKEGLFSTDHFFASIQDTSFAEGTSIQLHELVAIYPELLDSNITKVQKARGDMVRKLHNAGSTEYWHQDTSETIVATTLSHSIPSLMMDLMITKIHIKANNRTPNGQFQVALVEPKSFAQGVDLSQYLHLFQTRLVHEVLHGLTMNNQIDFDLTMTIDLLGETWLSIGMFGKPPVDYVAPTFCDSLFAPVLTQNDNNLATLAHDFNSLASNLGVQHVSPTAPAANYTMGGNNGFNPAI